MSPVKPIAAHEPSASAAPTARRLRPRAARRVAAIQTRSGQRISFTDSVAPTASALAPRPVAKAPRERRAEREEERHRARLNRREDGRPEEQQPVAAPVAHAEHVRDRERGADEERHDEETRGLDRQERERDDADRSDRRIDVSARDDRRLVVESLVGRVAGEHRLGGRVEDAEVERDGVVLDRADEERHDRDRGERGEEDVRRELNEPGTPKRLPHRFGRARLGDHEAPSSAGCGRGRATSSAINATTTTMGTNGCSPSPFSSRGLTHSTIGRSQSGEKRGRASPSGAINSVR